MPDNQIIAEPPVQQRIWPHYTESVAATVLRNGTIAVVITTALCWRAGTFNHWPKVFVLLLWPTFGGHFVEIGFQNHLRQYLPSARAVQTIARLCVWFVAGIGLVLGMMFTARLLGVRSMPWTHCWIGGFAFIGVELMAHSVLSLRYRPSFFNGRG